MTFVLFTMITKIALELHKTGDTFLSFSINNGILCIRDNVNGGTNGPETVTFQDPSINNLYTYVVGIDDFLAEVSGILHILSLALHHI